MKICPSLNLYAPIVEPQAMSLRTANSWVGMLRLRATSLHNHERQPQCGLTCC